MTYRELRHELHKLSEEQLDCDVTINIMQENEFYPAELGFTDETDVLDSGHPVIWTKER